MTIRLFNIPMLRKRVTTLILTSFLSVPYLTSAADIDLAAAKDPSDTGAADRRSALPKGLAIAGVGLGDDIAKLNSELSRANMRIDATAAVLKYVPIGTTLGKARAVLRGAGCQFGRSHDSRRDYEYAIRELPGSYLEQHYLVVDLIWERVVGRFVVRGIQAELQNRVSSDL